MGVLYIPEPPSCISISYLARSQPEPEENLHLYPKQWNRSASDRNWDWKADKLRPSPTRHQAQSHYYGSYCMDGMYAALHIVYHSNSIIEGLQKAVSYGGDADSIASVVGQILGAAYGLDRSVISLYLEKMYQYDQLQTLLKAYLLFNEQESQTQS